VHERVLLYELGNVGSLFHKEFVVVVRLHAVLLVDNFVDADEPSKAREDKANLSKNEL
jgi:hypothetical protein